MGQLRAHTWLLFLLVVVAGGAYMFYHEQRPCARPIAYAIGTLDPRFGVSQATFEKDIAEAAEIWDAAEHKQLFVYDPRAALKISLVYDSRQQLTKQEAALDQQITSLRAQAASIKQQYTALKAEYATASDEQKHALAAQINPLVENYNNLISQSNALAHMFNTDGLAGTQFEEGVYISDASGQRIDIYQFDDHASFVRVIAHELGHALGLEHNSGPDSIMNPINSGDTLAPSQDDTSALKALCGV